jgi:hypothetical protein
MKQIQGSPILMGSFPIPRMELPLKMTGLPPEEMGLLIPQSIRVGESPSISILRKRDSMFRGMGLRAGMGMGM